MKNMCRFLNDVQLHLKVFSSIFGFVVFKYCTIIIITKFIYSHKIFELL